MLRPGHKALECKENRVIDYTGIPDKDPEVAWNAIKEAANRRDLDDLKEVSQDFYPLTNVEQDR